MAICITDTSINFGTRTISNTPTGISINGFLCTAGCSIPPPLAGSVSGYTSGGTIPTGALNIIDKFPFASDTNATCVGTITQERCYTAGQSSSTHGYNSGGCVFTPPSTFAKSDTIDKFSFADESVTSDVGNLTLARTDGAGQSSSESGYTSGGLAPPYSNVIDKFPFASDTNASDVGDLSQTRSAAAGQSSSESGYTSGGMAPPYSNVIDKFPFASDANATDVGDLTQARCDTTGQSSNENGYTSAGIIPPFTAVNTIDKFSFSSDGNASDVGDLTVARYNPAGQSSTVSGYTSGGAGSVPSRNTIDKFPFATDSNATDVGNLSNFFTSVTGQQD